jgi:hypothetical protein
MSVRRHSACRRDFRPIHQANLARFGARSARLVLRGRVLGKYRHQLQLLA